MADGERAVDDDMQTTILKIIPFRPEGVFRPAQPGNGLDRPDCQPTPSNHRLFASLALNRIAHFGMWEFRLL